MLIVIALCEVGFWVVLAAGLVLRYVVRLRRAGGVVLACVPLVDVALLAATAVQLRSGAAPTATDGLAAVYLGASIAFGPTMLRWADARFAHRFAGGPPPPMRAKSGPEHARRERRTWYRHLVAYAIGCVLLLAAAALAEGDTGPLLGWIPRWGVIVAIDFLWSFSYTLHPRR